MLSFVLSAFQFDGPLGLVYRIQTWGERPLREFGGGEKKKKTFHRQMSLNAATRGMAPGEIRQVVL